MNTRNFEDLGYREIEMLKDILDAWMNDGLPDDFYEDGVVWEFNPSSGEVFLVNSDYQIAMLNGHRLESWYFTPNQGVEGFREDLINYVSDGQINSYEDIEYVLELCENAYDDDGIIACKKVLLYEDLKINIEGYEMTIDELDDKLEDMDLSVVQDVISNDCQRRVYEHDEYDDISFEVYIQKVYENDEEDDDDKIYEVVTIEIAD